MFELPQTKRYAPSPPFLSHVCTQLQYTNSPTACSVRRSDLRSPSFSPPPTTTHPRLPPDAAQQKLHSLLSTLLPLELPSPSHSQSNPPSLLSNADKPPPEDEPEYDFPLFTPHPTTAITNRVVLRTPTPPPTIEDIYLTSYHALAATQHRPLTYYFSSPSPSSPLLSCAISGEDILAHARRDKWLGQTYAWRLITVPASTTKPPPLPFPDWEKRKRCKPGKKRRIYLRQAALKKEVKKLAFEAQKQAEAERKKQEEEEANIKRMLKNRERKAKKRAREKAKKLAAGGGGGAVGFDGDGDGGESARESAGVEGEKMDVDG
ncbi:hypothetical protein L211DRAFT_853010 [Terfezia boudieri ATCC MYA-4762]|uniref:Uncharacterized protein n=1 Tax=Terfezia boudieri ATCC MYA-4762 TaxID=1051890 RepID=A0A3N4LE25_9PEZI|nr:hypothetical protein L211DRAFT_853010 [Terfezia boudieri ATCC MYA-4762]